MSRIPTLSLTVLLTVLTSSGCKDVADKKDVSVDGQAKMLLVNGDTLHYVEMGEGEPVILIHGALSSYTIWTAQMEPLSEHYRVIAYSRRTAWPNAQNLDDNLDSSPETNAQDLAALMMQLNTGPVHLVGHSWGATTILAYAGKHPDMVRTLTLGEPALNLEDALRGFPQADSLIAVSHQESALTRQLLDEGRTAEAIRGAISLVLGDAAYYDDAPQEVRDDWQRNLEDFYYVGKPGVLAATPKKSELRNLKVPVLLIEGEHSPAFLGMPMRVLDSVIPNSEYALLKNSSHGLEAEQPELFNEILLNFLSRH